MSDQKSNIPKDKFTFVQREGRIFDKEFETKPVGYFKDAMIRFSRNRTNVIATSILFTLILLSIFQPVFTTKNYVSQQAELSFLPPRIPILENFGIADGTTGFNDQPVDLSTVNLETGFQGNPAGYDPQFILEETREYYTIGCSDKTEFCQSGEAVMRLDSRSTRYTVDSSRPFAFSPTLESRLEIDVTDLETAPDTKLSIFVRVPGSDDFELLQEVTEPGMGVINVYDVIESDEPFSSVVRFVFESQELRDFVAIKSVGLYSNQSETPLIFDTGQPLTLYRPQNLPGEGGTYVRQNAEMSVISFRYDSYGALFGERRVNAFSINEYNEILAANPVCTPIENPDNPNGWLLPEGCPIKEVLNENEGVVVGGINFGSYNVVIDYALYQGYEEVPYHFFGTTAAGRDLFSLIWVATRTSLLIGLIVAGINITVGVVFGAISGYYGGAVDIIMQRFSEVIGRIPFLVILAIFISLLGSGIQTLIFILIVSGWIGVAYVTRTQFYRFKGREYVLASRTLGAKDMRLIFRHILPNGIGTIITASILLIPSTIFAESTISYLGFGIGHGTSFNILGITFSGVSVGVLLADARGELLSRPYLTVFPAIVISILMITFNMFGNALRDALNPALRGSL